MSELVREIERHNLVLDSLANSSSASACAPRVREKAVARLFSAPLGETAPSSTLQKKRPMTPVEREEFQSMSPLERTKMLRFATFGELPMRRSKCLIRSKAQYCREVQRKASIANFLRPRDAYSVAALLPGVVPVRKFNYRRVEMYDGYRYLMSCPLVDELVTNSSKDEDGSSPQHQEFEDKKLNPGSTLPPVIWRQAMTSS